MGTDLPSFRRNPPVVETVLGVQFEPIAGLTNAHLGAFWSSLGEGWPSVEDAPPIHPQFEEFHDRLPSLGLQLQLTQDPSARLRIRNAQRDAMIQVQNGRFHYNWLGEAGGDYRRYGRVRPELDAHLARFASFLVSRGLPPILPNQWEVTYVNHVPKGPLWSAPGDWSGILRGGVPAPLSIAAFSSLKGVWSYDIEPKRGRLHVELRQGRKRNQDLEVLVMTLTARGPANDLDTLAEGLDLGHTTIVQAFAELTSADAHRAWGRE